MERIKPKTVYTSGNGKWEIRTAPAPEEFRGHADHWLQIKAIARKGYKDITFSTMDEFMDDMPQRLDKGKNKDVPQAIVDMAIMIAKQMIEGGTK